MKKALAVSLLLFFFVNYSEASRDVTLKRLRYSSNENHTRIVVDVDGPVKYTSNRLADPDRLYFDIRDCVLSEKAMPPLSLNDGIIKNVRIAQFSKGTVRVVLDIQELKNYYAFTLDDPHRLVIDVYTKKSSTSPKNKNRPGRRFNGIRRVVIDPGHGGKDPGAIGYGGLREKKIVLDIGEKVGKILNEKYGLEVIYTRKKDLFVPLNERTEIANSKKADLFISIHANASRQRAARGIETYILNWTNDREAMRVAARENKISYKKMQKVQSELQMILLDLARDNKRNESVRLARNVQDSMISTLKKDYRNIENLGVKQALFYVLIGAEMPSILVETSFLSNREEEKRLSRTSYRNKIAEAIARGIMDYIKQSTLVVKRIQ
jgi:N-acetylmuramoyl-L-alanine amidase